jgi:hypothetical protein
MKTCRFAWLVAAASLSAALPAHAQVPVGKPAPAFSLKKPNGRTLSLASLRGKVVFLDFWGPS